MTALIVTVDTEEEGLWGGRYRRTGNTVRNVREVSRFQALCDEYSIRPTYLVDAPVVEDDAAAETLKAIHDDDRCEIGAHVHPWCNPPLEEPINEANSYLCNLPVALQRRKIAWLTEAIEQRFGRRPTSFRAGRYGLDAAGARILAELGYEIDSSVVPFTDYRPQGGPNFDGAPCEPYYPRSDDLARPASAGPLLEVPVGMGYSRRNFAAAHRLSKLARRAPLRQLRAVGILDRLGLARRIKLSPEQADAAAMTRLVDLAAARGARCLVLMFHSSSLLPGCSPYVRDAAALERFLAGLKSTFQQARQRGMHRCTLADSARAFSRASADAATVAADAAHCDPSTCAK